MGKEKLKVIEDGILGTVIRGLACHLAEMDKRAYEHLPHLHVSSDASLKEAEKIRCVRCWLMDATYTLSPDIPDAARDEIVELANKYIDLANEWVTTKLIELVKE